MKTPEAWEVRFGDHKEFKAVFKDRERAIQYAVAVHSHVEELYDLSSEQLALLDRSPYGLLDDGH